jgi:hypothetical protein
LLLSPRRSETRRPILSVENTSYDVQEAASQTCKGASKKCWLVSFHDGQLNVNASSYSASWSVNGRRRTGCD